MQKKSLFRNQNVCLTFSPGLPNRPGRPFSPSLPCIC